MIKLTVSEIIKALGGRMAGVPPEGSVTHVSTDSRQVREGDLFFAIRGDQFDGHDFIDDAFARGAAFAVAANTRYASIPPQAIDRRLILVDDTIAALGRLAAYHRSVMPAQVIAVVGSNGKTTTKGMIDHVLAGSRRGRSSPRSFNNAIGVPLTLLSATLADEYLVVEIGTNAPGEIAALSAIVRPDAAVVTSIGEEHLAGLGSLDGVALEETSVFAHLAPGGTAVVNIDAPELRMRLPDRSVKTVTFGTADDADLRISDIRYDAPWLTYRVNGRFDYRLRAPGAHNAWNAAGAIAIGRRFGMDDVEIASRLMSCPLPPMRMELVELAGVTYLNDAYNANPASMAEALRTLASMATGGRRIAVLGEMRELGAHSAALHRRVGAQLVECGIDIAILVGDGAKDYAEGVRAAGGNGTHWELVADVDDAARRLNELVHPGDLVLLKASRAVALERILDRIRAGHASASTTSAA